ncbi:hypothetical protein HDU86_004433 [Geranomyces michiganensis]|nr:hypothetical protein HDU86_004433 [Geranomyces michiganensis]
MASPPPSENPNFSRLRRNALAGGSLDSLLARRRKDAAAAVAAAVAFPLSHQSHARPSQHGPAAAPPAELGGSVDALFARRQRQAVIPPATFVSAHAAAAVGNGSRRQYGRLGGAAGAPLQRYEYDEDAGLEFGERIRDAAERAIEAGIRRREHKAAAFAVAPGELKPAEVLLRPDPPPPPVQLSPETIATTARLADENEFPTCYRNRIKAIREHRERLAQAASLDAPIGVKLGWAGGGAVSLPNLSAPLPKRAEEVVQRLYNPRNLTGVHVKRNDMATAAEMDQEERAQREVRRRERRSKPTIERRAGNN